MIHNSVLRRILLFTLLLSVLLFSACDRTESGGGAAMTVWIIDCGQGDAILVRFPDGTHMLVDGGGGKSATGILTFLDTHGVEQLETVVATHPHEDHMGGLDDVICDFARRDQKIGALYGTDASSDETFFSRFLSAAAKNNLSVQIPALGEYLVGGADTEWSVQCVGPVRTGHEDVNDDSLVLRVVFGRRAVLLTGDAEVVSEIEMIEAGVTLRADVLKVGHHGSYTASCDPFLDAVDPDFAVISCGKGNDYGHPHPDILKAASERSMTLYRTDRDGTVCIVTDGDSLEVNAAGKGVK